MPHRRPLLPPPRTPTCSTAPRLRWRSASAVGGLTLAVGLGGCALVNNEADAIWDLAPDQTLDADATTFTVGVTRVGCNSGETGTVNDPDITIEDDRIVIAFTVSPGEPRSADCQGNPAVPYDVELPEPLGDRELVDPQCEATSISDGDACTDDGIRYTPDAPPGG